MNDVEHFARMDAEAAHAYDGELTDEVAERLFQKATRIRSAGISENNRDEYMEHLHHAYEEKPWEDQDRVQGPEYL